MSGLNATFDNDPAHYDEMRACWLNDRREAFLVEHLSRFDTDQPRSVVEFGSGTGWLLGRLARRYPEWRFHGIEPIAAYVQYASEHYDQPNLSFSQGTAETAAEELEPRSFDQFLSNDVLHHMLSEPEAVRQAAKLARPGAHWMAIEPNALNPYAFAGQFLKSGERNFWPGRFSAQAREAGWHLQERRHLFMIPPFLKQPPDWLKGLERTLEGIPVIGGGVALEFVYRTPTENNDGA